MNQSLAFLVNVNEALRSFRRLQLHRLPDAQQIMLSHEWAESSLSLLNAAHTVEGISIYI